MNHGDVLYPIGAGLLAGLFVFAISAITGKERNFGIDPDLAVLIGTVTAFSVLAARRPDLAMWTLTGSWAERSARKKPRPLPAGRRRPRSQNRGVLPVNVGS